MAIVAANSKFIDGTSMVATFTSNVVNLERAGAISLELHAATGTHVGAVTLEVSNSGDNWQAIGWTDPSTGEWVTSLTVAAGSAFDVFLNFPGFPARFLRVVYTTAPTGTGSLDGYVFGADWSDG